MGNGRKFREFLLPDPAQREHYRSMVSYPLHSFASLIRRATVTYSLSLAAQCRAIWAWLRRTPPTSTNVSAKNSRSDASPSLTSRPADSDSPPQARIDRPVDKRRASHPLPLPAFNSKGCEK